MHDKVIKLSEPSLCSLLEYLDHNVIVFKERLAHRVEAIPSLKQAVISMREEGAPFSDLYALAVEHLGDNPCDRRALDILHDYYQAREYCVKQWQEWEASAAQTGPANRLNVLGLWQVCASVSAYEIEEVPILFHIDRLVWHLVHIIDEVVDTRSTHATRQLEEKSSGILCVLSVLGEFNAPNCRDQVCERYQQLSNEYLLHTAHPMPESSLVEQLYHKLIPNVITASFYNDIMRLVAGVKFEVRETTQAMREAIILWQFFDDMDDYELDVRIEVANIGKMCLQQTGEKLSDSAGWPTVKPAILLPETMTLMRRMFQLLCHWLAFNRPDVTRYLFCELERLYPRDWHQALIHNHPGENQSEWL